MKINQTNLFTIIEAEEGMILINKEGYGAYKIYLGINDSPDNYKEIPEDDYIEPTPEEEPETLEDMVQRILSEEANK